MSNETGKKLVIVESPSKAKTISRFLGKDYVVEASYGHVRDLPDGAKDIPESKRKLEWARLGVDVNNGFQPLYVVPTTKAKQIKRLKDALKNASSLLLATDEDREGESISWHVLEVLAPKKEVPVHRIVFHEVTKEAIDAAIRSPRALDDDLVRAQEARRILDRLYGYTLSPLLWKKIARGLSAGRVQSVAVRLCVMRERERRAFVSSSYWDLTARIRGGDGEFDAQLVRVGESRLADGKSFNPTTGALNDATRLLLGEGDAQDLALAAHEATPWSVTSLDTAPAIQKPAPPFTTSTLQQEANRKLRFAAKRTMQVAQGLYEGVDLGGERVGLITYMRTDSVTLSERALTETRRMVEDSYGKDYLPTAPVRYKTKSKNAQEAHEAIRPTDVRRRPEDVKRYLTDEQYKLYDLIWKRTLACQMLPAKFERTQVEVTVPAAEPLVFSASGRRILFPGFLRAYVEGSDDPDGELGDKETILPALQVGEKVDAISVEARGHTTKPPLRYTEASLVKRLEEEGIGRPSTYATIISTIQDRGYIFRRGNELVPTFTAFCVTLFLESNFRDLVDTEFTAKLEDELDDVAAGRRKWVDTVTGFYFGPRADGIAHRAQNVGAGYPLVSIGVDPVGLELVVKVGRFGPYLQRGEGGEGNFASIPPTMAPDELTVEAAIGLLERGSGDGLAVAVDAESGTSISVKEGRFGPYVELALTVEQKERGEKPKRVSLPKGLAPEAVTAEIAEQLISLPRTVGFDPESGDEVSAGIGRYGPFVKMGDEFRSLPTWEQTLTIDLHAALELLKSPKPGRSGSSPKAVVQDFGVLEGAAGRVTVRVGRYGPYVTDGKTNAQIPKLENPAQITRERALELLANKRK